MKVRCVRASPSGSSKKEIRVPAHSSTGSKCSIDWPTQVHSTSRPGTSRSTRSSVQPGPKVSRPTSPTSSPNVPSVHQEVTPPAVAIAS
jgi:hypothetical protein